MTPITIQDLLSPAEYENQREQLRRRIIALKKRRRIAVGELVTLVFENRETVLFQIQEMVRTERIFDPQKIQEEIDVYNALLPGPDELSATLFVEITDMTRLKELLDSFQELDRPGTLYLRVGDLDIHASFEAGHSKEDKISAVHFVRFLLSSRARQKLMDFAVSALLAIYHPYYQREALVPQSLREEWLRDLDESRNASEKALCEGQ